MEKIEKGKEMTQIEEMTLLKAEHDMKAKAWATRLMQNLDRCKQSGLHMFIVSDTGQYFNDDIENMVMDWGVNWIQKDYFASAITFHWK